MAYNPTIELMVVDDDLHVLAVLEDLFFVEENIRVTAMSDSVEAIELVQGKTFDIIITDLMMPKADGLEVTRAVHAANPKTLVIIITGFASLETTLEAIHLGVYDYITKPFQIDEFRLLVANAAQRIRLERENADLKEQLRVLEANLARLQDAHGALAAERETLKRDIERRAAETPAEPAPAPQPAGASADKIGLYERMADDYRVRLKRQRESLGLTRRTAGVEHGV